MTRKPNQREEKSRSIKRKTYGSIPYTPMAVEDIKTIEDWDILILDKQTITTAMFWADWCPYCQKLKPIFESMPQKFPQIRFVKVNVDQKPEIASRYGIQVFQW